MKKAIQLCTVRKFLETDAEACIHRLARLGVEEVEGFDLVQLMSIYPLLQEHNIECASSFLFWPHVTGNTTIAHQIRYPWLPSYWGIQHEIELARYMNLDSLIMGYWHPHERAHASDWYRLADCLNSCGESMRQAGLQLLYHHHAFEFKPLDTKTGFQILLENTDPELVGFELDTLWWEVAGYTLSDLPKDLVERTTQLHLKSARLPSQSLYDEQLFPELNFRPLGGGDITFDYLRKWVKLVQPKRAFYEQDESKSIWKDVEISLDALSFLPYPLINGL